MKGRLGLGARCWRGTAGVVLMCLAVPAAVGAPITYVFSGPASGTLGATPFAGAQVTVTANADTAGIGPQGPGVFCVDSSGMTITIAGLGTSTTTAANYVFVNQAASVWGYTNGTCAAPIGDWLDVANGLAATYGLATAIGPTTGVQGFAGSVSTTNGVLTFTAPPVTFQAIPATFAAIPTLSPWAVLMLVVLIAAAAFFFSGRRPANR